MTDSRDYFNQTAAAFSQQYTAHRPDFVERIAVWTRAIDDILAPGMNVIDLGCGEGTLSRIVARRGNFCVGIDQSEAMITLATERANHEGLSSLLRYEIASLPYVSGSGERQFGLLLCSSVLEYVEDINAVLQSLGDLLTPGGYLLVSFPNRRSTYRRFERVRRRLPLGRSSYLNYQKHVLNESDARVLLQGHGFATHEVQYYGQPPHPWLFGRGDDAHTKTLFLMIAQRHGGTESNQ